MNNDQRLLKHETRLLRRERSYRSALLGAMFLLVVTVVGGAFVLGVEADIADVSRPIISMGVFWGMVIAYALAKLDHIATVRHYRPQLHHE